MGGTSAESKLKVIEKEEKRGTEEEEREKRKTREKPNLWKRF